MPHYDLTWPEGFDPEIGVLVGTLQDSNREWRENLENPVADAMVWQPYPDGPSIGGVLLHMAAAERYWLQLNAEGIKMDPADPALEYDGRMDQNIPLWPTPPTQPIEWYLGVLDQTRQEMIILIYAHSDPASTHTTRWETVTYRWILAHVAEHDSYHGGQAVLLHEMYKKTH